jgi:hypothetical protein
MDCVNCEKPLKRSQWTTAKDFKSCPGCSQKVNVNEHFYYPYPDGFDTTEHRVSTPHPDGPQSHCKECRKRGFTPPPVACRELRTLA